MRFSDIYMKWKEIISWTFFSRSSWVIESYHVSASLFLVWRCFWLESPGFPLVFFAARFGPLFDGLFFLRYFKSFQWKSHGIFGPVGELSGKRSNSKKTTMMQPRCGWKTSWYQKSPKTVILTWQKLYKLTLVVVPNIGDYQNGGVMMIMIIMIIIVIIVIIVIS